MSKNIAQLGQRSDRDEPHSLRRLQAAHIGPGQDTAGESHFGRLLYTHLCHRDCAYLSAQAYLAKHHHMENVLPLMCNCDHLAMQKIHACLIREGTCVTADCCDYCIIGDRNPLAKEYDLIKSDNGLLLSVIKK